jgi:hypothetical protein
MYVNYTNFLVRWRNSGYTFYDTNITGGGGSSGGVPWKHYAAVYDGSSVTAYVNAVPSTPTATSGAIISNSDTRAGAAVAGPISDIVRHNRALSLPEIQILANRSDPMLGGLIQNPRRRFFPIKSSIISTTPIRRYYIVRGVGVQCVY